MSGVGSIIVVDYQIFKNEGKLTQIDHVKKRPVLIIAENEENIYYVTMTSQPGLGHVGFQSNGKTQYINKRDIYSKPSCGYEEKGNISNLELLKVLKEIYAYHMEKQTDEFKEIEPLLLKSINDILQKIGNSKKSTNKKR